MKKKKKKKHLEGKEKEKKNETKELEKGTISLALQYCTYNKFSKHFKIVNRKNIENRREKMRI